MTPVVRAYLLGILARRRAWSEDMRAVLRAHGLPTHSLDETLAEIAAVEREVAGARPLS